jgi:small subunit ribosomal protein S4e
MEKSADNFRLMYDTKGRFVLHSVPPVEAQFKLARVVSLGTTSKSIPYLVTSDGRTIRYPDPILDKNDTVKIDLATGKVIDHIKFEPGNLAMITKGSNTGRVGVVHDVEHHPGSFDVVHVKDTEGVMFATRLGNVFVIGKGADPKNAVVTLPRGNGIKRTIFHVRRVPWARSCVCVCVCVCVCPPAHALVLPALVIDT